jgi:hypothetical protein
MGNSESHATFVDGIKRLLVEDVRSDDREFWEALFTAPMSVEDVFEIISPDHIRQLRQKRPQNLQVFLHRIVAQMSSVCEAAEGGEDSEPRPLAPAMATSASTSIRLLTRIVPFLLEEQGDEVIRDILWRPGGFEVPATTEAEGTDASREDTSGGPATQEKSSPSAAVQGGSGTVCANEILHYIGRFLFLPHFSVTPAPRSKTQKGDGKGTVRKLPTCRVDPRVVWKSGVGIALEMPRVNSPQHYRSRCEVLRCLLACLSGPLFQSADDYQEAPSLWLLRLTGGEVCHTANLFCSLMSTVFTYDPVGWGLPYGGYFASGTEEDLVDVSLQVLCVLMDFDPKEEKCLAAEGMVKEKSEEASSDAKQKPRNVYRFMLANVSKDSEIDLIFNGIVKLLSTVHQEKSTYLPNSFRSVGFYQEALVLLWHLMTLNPAFMKRLVDHLDTNQILLPVLFLLQQAQNNLQLVGLLHTASFVLLVLSSERSFSVRLNEPYSSKMPLTIPTFKGCHADVLTLSLHKVISDGLMKPQNDALVEMLMTVLCNISPYIKCYALESCLKLLSLVERCSRPVFLFKSAFANHGLIFLLELLNNVVQYQYEGNAMLVYSILRQKEVFKHLSILDLPAHSKTAAVSADASPPSAETIPKATADVAQDTASPGAPSNGDVVDGEEISDEPWVPTEEWLSTWKKKMPLQALTCLIDYLAPQVEAQCKQNDVTDQDEVLAFLRRTTMVGILPVPHPIVIRTYQASSYTAMWFTSYMWGVIFTRSQRLPLYDWKKIRLVVINQ